MAQPFLVDAVAYAWRNVPLDRHVEGGKPPGGIAERLHGYKVVAIAVNEQDRRPGADFAGERLRLGIGRQY